MNHSISRKCTFGRRSLLINASIHLHNADVFLAEMSYEIYKTVSL